MKRLPVIAIIRETYQFTFTHLGAIIGLIWLPMVIVTVGQFFVIQHYGAQIQAAFASGNTAAAGPAALTFLVFQMVKLGFWAVMLVPVTQLALGQRQGGAMIHFAFGAPEWRTFRTLLGVWALMIPMGLLLALVGMRLLTPGVPNTQLLIAELVAVLMLAGMAYFLVRLTAVLLPVLMSDEKQPLIRCWTLSAGQFWALFGIQLGALFPAMMLMLVLQQVLVPTSRDMTAAEALGGGANLPMSMGLDFLLAPLIIGLWVGASVFSFRALTRTDISA